MTPLTALAASFRKAKCRDCPTPCALQTDDVARSAPGAVCRLRSWNSYRPDGSATSIVSAPAAIAQVSNPEAWGPRMWAELHAWALGQGSGVRSQESDSAWLEAFRRRIPVCPCRGHWREVLAALPPPLGGTPAELFAWTVAAHNAVTRLLGKPEMSQVEAEALWKGDLAPVAGALAPEAGAR